MRIAICTDIYLPQLSGVADSIALASSHLRRLGHAVRVYAPAIRGSEDEPGVARLPSLAIPGSGGGLALVFPAGAMNDLRRFRPDLVHAHTFSSLGMFALYAARRLRLPLVGTDHTFPADYLHYLKLDFPPLPFLIRRAAAWYYNRCALVLAPSRAMIDQLRSSGMTAPARVVSNPIPPDLFRPLADREALKRSLGVGPAAILLFGRMAREKNWDMAIDVFAEVARRRSADLVVIGDGPCRRSLERRVQQSGLAGSCRFLGALRGELLVEAVNACDVFLITSKSETQSMAMLQAAACGLPIVAVRAGGLPEYVVDGTTGLVVEPDDRAGAVEAVSRLLDDGVLARRLGMQGRASVLRCSPAAVASELQSLYEEVLQPRRTVAA